MKVELIPILQPNGQVFGNFGTVRHFARAFNICSLKVAKSIIIHRTNIPKW